MHGTAVAWSVLHRHAATASCTKYNCAKDVIEICLQRQLARFVAPSTLVRKRKHWLFMPIPPSSMLG
jgi:hypothetical protein